jgi:hypothetical protein
MRTFLDHIFFSITVVCSILLTATLMGCESIEGLDYLKEAPTEYAGDMIMDTDSQKFRGVGATFIAPEKDITVYSPAVIDYLYVHSCGRFERFPQFGEPPIKKNFVPYKYVPMKNEKDPCTLFFETYNLKGVSAWSMMAFRRGDASGPGAKEMPAITYCNGQKKTFNGHSVCQTKTGVEMAIEFAGPDPVKIKTRGTCHEKQISPTEFRLRPEKWCYAVFSNGKKRHYLSALGYKRPLIRE